MQITGKSAKGTLPISWNTKLRLLCAITQQQVCNKEKEIFFFTQHILKASGHYGDQMNTRVPKRWDRVPKICRWMKQQAQPLLQNPCPETVSVKGNLTRSSPPFSWVSPHFCMLDRPGWGVTHSRCSCAFISWGK